MRLPKTIFSFLITSILSIFVATAQQTPLNNANTKPVIDSSDVDNPTNESEITREVFSGDFANVAMPPTLNIPEVTKYYPTWQTKYVRTKIRGMEGLSEDTIRIALLLSDSSQFVMPFKGEFLSPFGKRGKRTHTGVDIRLNHGDPVVCAFDGVVRFSDISSGYGKCVVVRHYNGLETVYAHLSSSLAKPNQVIKAGEVLGLGGRTGRASCNHLHFEIRFREEAFNPKQVIDFDESKLVSDTLKLTHLSFGYSRDYMPGMKIQEPNTSDEKSLASTKSKTTNKAKTNKYYSVKQGDTLYSIAKKQKTTINNLCKLNGISSKTKLKIGRKLRIK